jgi:hypothetical protein
MYKNGFQFLILLVIVSCSVIKDTYANDVAIKDTYAKSVSQFGITWTFDKEYQVGQFANGDNWIVGPVNITNIVPPSLGLIGTTTVEGFTPGRGTEAKIRIMNGSMINPSPKKRSLQGYDNEMYQWHPKNGRMYDGHYDSLLNVAFNISYENPLTVSPASSLVSTISLEKGSRPQLKTAAILTILASPAPEGSFRPPYSGSDKTVKFNKNSLKYHLLKKLVKVSSTPELSSVEQYFERPWLDHVPNWVGRYCHPDENMHDYGREISTQIGEAALMLHLDFTNEQKENLLIRYVQLGIDLFGIIKDGGKDNWLPSGGHTNGRKWPIMFAGFMLDDAEMKNIGKKSGDYLYSNGYGLDYFPPDYIQFNEDGQTFYVSQDDVDRTHSEKWEPDHRNVKNSETLMYEPSDIGMPEWGIHHTKTPFQDNKHWKAVYRSCCTANSYGGGVLAALIMERRCEWNHNALFDYMDRYMSIEEKGQWKRQKSRFVEDMWDKYRNDYPPVWKNNNFCL